MQLKSTDSIDFFFFWKQVMGQPWSCQQIHHNSTFMLPLIFIVHNHCLWCFSTLWYVMDQIKTINTTPRRWGLLVSNPTAWAHTLAHQDYHVHGHGQVTQTLYTSVSSTVNWRMLEVLTGLGYRKIKIVHVKRPAQCMAQSAPSR